MEGGVSICILRVDPVALLIAIFHCMSNQYLEFFEVAFGNKAVQLLDELVRTMLGWHDVLIRLGFHFRRYDLQLGENECCSSQTDGNPA